MFQSASNRNRSRETAENAEAAGTATQTLDGGASIVSFPLSVYGCGRECNAGCGASSAAAQLSPRAADGIDSFNGECVRRHCSAPQQCQPAMHMFADLAPAKSAAAACASLQLSRAQRPRENNLALLMLLPLLPLTSNPRNSLLSLHRRKARRSRGARVRSIGARY